MGRSELVVTWEHSTGAPRPCYWAYDTAKPFSLLLDEIGPLMARDGISITHGESLVPGTGRTRILLNGLALEDLLSGVGAAQDYCRASRCMATGETYRHVVRKDGTPCEEAPEIYFRKAILFALEEPEKVNGGQEYL
ncbi:hypothetical protein J2741_002416 [Methanolinea mesophila]|uniref:DUF2703 domain-containing protein n=1 Tax=Methanolinea mesophila TaxID=547055 RepID=UPI001AE8D2B1|nr:DUF2703 domain-containing protein [Methanolinea mesophila]MBP1929820.1 hypothetical protein [Methanolinea mesophila]